MKITFNNAVNGDFTTKLIYFTALKQHALAQAQDALREVYGDDLHLRLIDREAADFVEEVWKPLINKKTHKKDRGISNNIDCFSLLPDDFSQKALSKFSSPLVFCVIESFDLAIWKGDELCGLSAGVSKNDDAIRVFTTEGSPDSNNQLKGEISNIVDVASSYYARACGASKVAYWPPYSSGAREKHEKQWMGKESMGNKYLYVRNISDIEGLENGAKGAPDFTVEIE